MAKAKRGGVPGTIPDVEAYLNVRELSSTISVEDGRFGKHPIWMTLFYCLRLGDDKAIATVAKKLFNVTHCSTLTGILAGLEKKSR